MQSINPLMLGIVIANLLFAPVLQAEGPGAPATSVITDVELGDKGLLLGQLVDSSGIPVADKRVVLHASKEQNVVTRTDADGHFGFEGVQGGVVELTVENTEQVVRAWAPGTAPPQASPAVLFTDQAGVVRGQWSPAPPTNAWAKRMKHVLANPVVVAGLVGAAIAIPVAIAESNDDDTGS